MSEFFVDANVIIYSALNDPRQEACAGILWAVGRREAAGRTSALVLEEVWNTERRRRIPQLAGLTEQALSIFRPLLPVTAEAFALALEIQATDRLGTHDRVHIGTCLANGIHTIVTADRAFDQVTEVRRADPLCFLGLAGVVAQGGDADG